MISLASLSVGIIEMSSSVDWLLTVSSLYNRPSDVLHKIELQSFIDELLESYVVVGNVDVHSTRWGCLLRNRKSPLGCACLIKTAALHSEHTNLLVSCAISGGERY